MKFNDYYKLYSSKFNSYTLDMCKFALADCHETLGMLGDSITENYSQKIWAEIDALRDRQMTLNKKAKGI